MTCQQISSTGRYSHLCLSEMSRVQQEQGTQQTTKKTQPGVVLGPDGKPCKPCTAFRNWNPVKAASVQKTSTSAGNNPKADDSFAGIASAMSAFAAGSVVTEREATRQDGPPEDCPADVEQLGRATWTFLHTTAAYYPESPTPVQRTRMLGLLMALPVLYPCSWCASHLGSEMQRHPPDVSGRVGLSRWLCERHNEVNGRLGKPLFNCSLRNIDERWKDGPSDGRCD